MSAQASLTLNSVVQLFVYSVRFEVCGPNLPMT